MNEGDEQLPWRLLGGCMTLPMGHSPCSGLYALCIAGLFITYVMLKNRKVTKKVQ